MNCKKNASGNPSEEKRLFNLGVAMQTGGQASMVAG